MRNFLDREYEKECDELSTARSRLDFSAIDRVENMHEVFYVSDETWFIVIL